MWIQERLDRLRQIVAEAVTYGVTPKELGFADYIHHKTAEFGLTPKTSKEYIHTLILAWKHNYWNSYVKFNPYLTEEVINKWLEQHSKRQY